MAAGGAAGIQPRQASLFDRPKVIPFESIAAGRVARERVARARRQTPTRPHVTAPQAGQQSLDFHRRPVRPQAVHGEAPIAPPGLRLRAAAVDLAMCGVGLGLAAAVFHLVGGAAALPPNGRFLYGGCAAALVVFYYLYWSILGRESPGQQLLRLRVLTFDDASPSWQTRLLRTAAAGLSLLSAGLGLVWSLVDDEKLTWHDHISRTFPTQFDRHPRTFHRK